MDASRRGRILGLASGAGVSIAISVYVTQKMRKRRRRAQLQLDGWQVAGHVSDLEPGPAGWEALTFFTHGDGTVKEGDGEGACALLELGGESGRRNCVAFARGCPHAGIDLLGGDVEDLGSGPIIACPAHTYLFDATTGSCLWDASRCAPPSTPAMRTFDVVEESDEIWVRVRSPAAVSTAEAWDQKAADALQMEMVNRALDRKFGPDEDSNASLF